MPAGRLFVPCALLVLIASACTGGDGPGGQSPSSSAPSATAVSETPRPTAAGAPSPAPSAGPLRLDAVASGFRRPTFVTAAGDGSGRLFVVEKPGTIRLLRPGSSDPVLFLDVSPLVLSSGSEQGLLGLAFHPRFKDNGRFFIAYTAREGNGTNTVAEYTVDRATHQPDPASAKILLAIPDRYPNHNGGMLAFGPDGYLYIGTGDGGGGGDPLGSGQSLDTFLGKILRIDVDQGSPYAVPPDNPFASRTGETPEIWAYGLRNPWRFSFDHATGDLWIADVGQGSREEVDFQPATSHGGENYGWNTMEGSHCYQPDTGCDRAGLVLPVYDYAHDRGCSVTGGYVYRGTASPARVGTYYFVDYCRGVLMSLRRDGTGAVVATEILRTNGSVSSLGEDEAGEIYLAGDQDGTIYRLAGG